MLPENKDNKNAQRVSAGFNPPIDIKADKKTPKRESGRAAPSKETAGQMPAISLPKGGGAIKGIGEKFEMNPVTGTGSFSVPIQTTPSRGDFAPELALSYDSGAGNGPFGFGWNLSIPSITRKTDKGLPKYEDADESDEFILSGAEDLVPVLMYNNGKWKREEPDNRTINGVNFSVRQYRPRTEGLFARIEQWMNKQNGDIHWRSVSKDNITTIYGKDEQSRIYDPADPLHIFSWLIRESYDDKGNAIVYKYKQEDASYVDPSSPEEKNRLVPGAGFANRYLKRIQYGNSTPHVPGEDLALRTDWFFELVFDYGEHDDKKPTPTDSVKKWVVREDPFSTYRAGFEVRTYRLCRRVFMFHHFSELGATPCLVRSTEFTYTQSPIASFITSVTQSGYVRKADGTYLKKPLPELEFEYSKAQVDDTIRMIDPDSLENLPMGLDGGLYQWIDLNGEGLSGILTQQSDAWFYKPNRGNAKFAPLQRVATIPSVADLNSGQQQLMDLAGDGQIDLVQFRDPLPGYYERTHEDQWGVFTPFKSCPNVEWNDPNLKFIDLTGDGHTDIMISEDNVFTWYPSLAEQGFGPSKKVRKIFDDEKGPALVFSDGTQSVYLADMSADGLNDIVRIRNGEVCYWPNLGYGHFGAKVTMDNPPRFDLPNQFDQKRIRLGDIDGSGTTDIIYLGCETVSLYFNQSGNGWSKPQYLKQFPHTDNLSSVTVVDLKGNGTACIVWSSPLPGYTGRQMRYIDLMGGQKPHLMTLMKNNMGAETRVHYVSSTKFYLEDGLKNQPWVTRLPFPVHVVERVETYDRISKNRFVTRYAYHHGYFDGIEREFRGFGMVEQWDTEEIGTIKADASSSAATNLDEASYVPPVKTKTWFHTGAYIRGEKISGQFEKAYYREPGLTDEQYEAMLLPDTVLPVEITLSDSTGLSRDLNSGEIREACRALRGSILRQEVYAEDGLAKSKVPYTVSEQNYEIKWLQPRETNKHGVFFVHPRETINYHYERNPADPRTSHQLTLEADPFGNVLKSAAIGYPRRSPAYPEQAKTLITYTETDFINKSDKKTFYRIGVPAETRTYEITGLSLSANPLFTMTEILAAVKNAKKIDYEVPLTAGVKQKRLIERTRNIYYKNDLSGPLKFRELESLALPYEGYQTAFTPGLLTDAYKGKVTTAMLKNDGKYVDLDNDGNWWIPSGRQVFDPAKFYLSVESIDPFGGKSYIRYDNYHLLIEEAEDPLKNIVTAKNNYRTMLPWLITDPNQNRSGVRFDELGLVMASAVMGKAGNNEGDSLDLTTPESSSLDDPTTKLEYDLFNWKKNNKPNYVKIQARELHGPANPRWQVSYTYSDGLGREVMQKVQAEPGKARTLNAQGAVVELQANPRWTGTGRTIFNNKGKPVKQYEPYFSVTHEYEDEKKLVEYGVTPVIHYDPLERVIRTDLPDGTYTKVEFDPWMQKSYDQNDTAYDPADTTKSSKWYKTKIALPNTDPGYRAAKLTEAHADTPQVVHLDTLGRPFLTVDDNGSFGKYETHVRLDIEGNQLEIKDAKSRTIAKNTFDMSGQQIYLWSADAGENHGLNNVLDNPVRSWDSEGHGFRAKYDKLHRPTHLLVNKDNGPEVLVEFTIYGENVKSAENFNLKGEVYQQYDQAGSVSNHEFDFKGNLKKSIRRLAKTYKQTIDWVTLDNIPKTQDNLLNSTAIDNTANQFLEKESFTSETTFDALNRPITLKTPDKSVTYPGYNEANLLEKIEVDIKASGQKKLFVKNINYNEKGQRELIEYANATPSDIAQTSIKTEYKYDKDTFRLTHMKTTRSSDNAKLQDLKYTYDPVGNITEIRDDAHQSVFFNNAKIDPHTKYTYDPIYRLIYAEGREHGGQLPQPQRTHEDFPLNDIPQPNSPEALRTYTESYVYDAVGNIMKMNHTAKNGSWTRGYRYDEKGTNRLTSTSKPGDDLLGSYSGKYKHDKNGNMTQMPHLSTLKWDHEDQLKEVDLGGGGKAFYTYDSEGARVRKVAVYQNGGVKERIYLGGYEIFREYVSEAAMANGNIKKERETLHVMDDEQRIALVETETRKNSVAINNPQPRIRYQFSNHLGSASIETDPEGKIISFEEYYPYGGTAYHATKSGVEVSAKRYRYNGKEKDEETGLYYYGARYYSAWLGRWTSCDPIEEVGSVSLYEYTESNPIVFRDPSGIQLSYGSQNPSASQSLAGGGGRYLRYNQSVGVRYYQRTGPLGLAGAIYPIGLVIGRINQAIFLLASRNEPIISTVGYNQMCKWEEEILQISASWEKQRKMSTHEDISAPLVKGTVIPQNKLTTRQKFIQGLAGEMNEAASQARKQLKQRLIQNSNVIKSEARSGWIHTRAEKIFFERIRGGQSPTLKRFRVNPSQVFKGPGTGYTGLSGTHETSFDVGVKGRKGSKIGSGSIVVEFKSGPYDNPRVRVQTQGQFKALSGGKPTTRYFRVYLGGGAGGRGVIEEFTPNRSREINRVGRWKSPLLGGGRGKTIRVR